LDRTAAKSIKSTESVCATTTDPHYAKVRLYGDYYYYGCYGDDPSHIITIFNTVAGWWAQTGVDNANMELIAKSIKIWDCADESEACYEADDILELAFAFRDWGNAKNLLGTWKTSYWNGDTDLCILFTGNNVDSGAGYGIHKTAGVKYSNPNKYGVVELYTGLYSGQVKCILSHEMGHMFSGGHEDNEQYGHRAWAWREFLMWRYTAIWSVYHSWGAWGSRFSCDGVNSAGPGNNNAYYIHEWRDTNLRTPVDDFEDSNTDGWVLSPLSDCPYPSFTVQDTTLHNNGPSGTNRGRMEMASGQGVYKVAYKWDILGEQNLVKTEYNWEYYWNYWTTRNDAWGVAYNDFFPVYWGVKNYILVRLYGSSSATSRVRVYLMKGGDLEELFHLHIHPITGSWPYDWHNIQIRLQNTYIAGIATIRIRVWWWADDYTLDDEHILVSSSNLGNWMKGFTTIRSRAGWLYGNYGSSYWDDIRFSTEFTPMGV
jgi:hypothetical protein